MKTTLKSTTTYLLILSMVAAVTLSGIACNKKSDTLLDPDSPVTLTMWHVYGEQADSPMQTYINEFNATEGKKKGVIIDVTLVSNTSQIGKKLKDAQADKPGSPDMPDLFFCHPNDALSLGADNLIDWKDYFSQEELDGFIPQFISDGIIEDKLSILPTSKSTSLLFIAGGVFDRFAAAKGVSLSDLSTWDGFFEVAQKYFDWSGGKPFCALDYLIRLIELYSISGGESDFYKDNWYDLTNAGLIGACEVFANAIAKGYIVVSDSFANTQVMTGQVCAGMGSSAAILYYNDRITYPDNTSEEVNLKVLPLPQRAGKPKVVSHAGAGLSANKTTEQKAEAATVFARWFTEENRNMEFVLSAGYMPVKTATFARINDFNYKTEAYERLYNALSTTVTTCSFKSEPNFDGYFKRVTAFYNSIRNIQRNLPEKYANGESQAQIVDEIKNALNITD